MRILFTDIDGCLNCLTTKERYRGMLGIEKSKIKILDYIVQKTGVKLVLSSTWRLDKDWLGTMEKCGINRDYFIDKTPYLIEGLYCRGKEIKKWIDDNKFEGKYAVIDDDDDMLPHQKLFKTSFKTGLTKELAEKIIDYFGGE